MQILPTISPEKVEPCLGLHHSRIPDTKTSWNHVVGASDRLQYVSPVFSPEHCTPHGAIDFQLYSPDSSMTVIYFA